MLEMSREHADNVRVDDDEQSSTRMHRIRMKSQTITTTTIEYIDGNMLTRMITLVQSNRERSK
jgi:hypothetical protein